MQAEDTHQYRRNRLLAQREPLTVQIESSPPQELCLCPLLPQTEERRVRPAVPLTHHSTRSPPPCPPYSRTSRPSRQDRQRVVQGQALEEEEAPWIRSLVSEAWQQARSAHHRCPEITLVASSPARLTRRSYPMRRTRQKAEGGREGCGLVLCPSSSLMVAALSLTLLLPHFWALAGS